MSEPLLITVIPLVCFLCWVAQSNAGAGELDQRVVSTGAAHCRPANRPGNTSLLSVALLTMLNDGIVFTVNLIEVFDMNIFLIIDNNSNAPLLILLFCCVVVCCMLLCCPMLSCIMLCYAVLYCVVFVFDVYLFLILRVPD